jgi:acyl carrier protein
MESIEVIKKLQDIFIKISNNKSITLDNSDVLSDIKNWDVMELSLLPEIQKEFKIEFSAEDIIGCKCVGDIVWKIINHLQLADNYRNNKTSLGKILHSEFSIWNEASFVQKRLYLLNQKNPEAMDYNITFAVKIEGILDYTRFEYAVKKSVDLHPMLNARFNEINGELMYSICKNSHYNINYVTESKYAYEVFEDFKKKEIEKFIKPYNLKRDVLYRINTIKYSENICLVIMDFHHIIFDGATSLDVFLNSISKFYNSKQINLSPYNYNDYVMWQREFHCSNDYIQESQYWKELFKTPSSLCNILVDNPEKRKNINKSRYVKSLVHNKQEIETFCKNVGCTKFSFWISILNIVLSKLTYQNDISIGTFVSGRKIRGCKIEELNSVIGMFVNTLPVRNYVDNKLIISEFVKRVHENNNILYK